MSKTRKTYLAGLVAARLAGVPHIVHVGSSLDPISSAPRHRLDGWSYAARLRAPHQGYFVVCEHIADQLRDRGISTRRIYNVQNAVDTDRFHPDRIPLELSEQFLDSLARIDDNSFRIGYVGGLHPYKGLADLAEAIKRVSEPVTVVVAGDGPQAGTLRRQFGDSARFLGAVPYDQVPALYHEFDAFVLPSRTEGLPRVVLEAQATGTPVLATRVGGVPEIVADGRTGLLCDPGHPSSIASGIRRLVGDEELRRRLAREGRRAVETTYSWPELYDRYEKFLGAIAR